MKKTASATVAFALLVSACVETTSTTGASSDPITQAISGKTIVSENAQFTMGTNGSLNGETSGGTTFKGAWTVRDGQFCRTISEPASFVGTECQKAELGDGTITITGRNGPIVYSIE